MVGKFESTLSQFEETPRNLELRDEMVLDPQRAAALRALGYAGGAASPVEGAIHPHAQEHLNAGVFQFLRNDPDQAKIWRLRRAMTMAPGNMTARIYLGFTLYRRQNYAETVRVLRSVPEAGDREYLLRMVLADSFIRLGRKPEAREQLEAALKLNLSPEERLQIETQLKAM